MHNVMEDISTLTAVPEKILNRLVAAASYAICQNILEDNASDETLSGVKEFDIGIGTLYIKYMPEEDDIKFKFKPTESLRKNIHSTYKEGSNLMRNLLSKRLGQKLLEVYKDLC